MPCAFALQHRIVDAAGFAIRMLLPLQGGGHHGKAAATVTLSGAPLAGLHLAEPGTPPKFVTRRTSPVPRIHRRGRRTA
jgi:hypothetical protein